jgi:hypothetical protein
MSSRAYVQKEWRLLSWWLASFHPNAEIHMNVRLGPTTPAANLLPELQPPDGILRLRNRWIDAVVIENGAVSLVEAKLEPDPGIFSQLVHYARKFRADPEYSAYADGPLNLVAVVYNDDPSVAVEAPWYGVQWLVFRPNLEGFPPAVTRGQELGQIGSELPANWPARIAWLTGKPIGSF